MSSISITALINLPSVFIEFRLIWSLALDDEDTGNAYHGEDIRRASHTHSHLFLKDIRVAVYPAKTWKRYMCTSWKVLFWDLALPLLFTILLFWSGNQGCHATRSSSSVPYLKPPFGFDCQVFAINNLHWEFHTHRKFLTTTLFATENVCWTLCQIISSKVFIFFQRQRQSANPPHHT